MSAQALVARAPRIDLVGGVEAETAADASFTGPKISRLKNPMVFFQLLN